MNKYKELRDRQRKEYEAIPKAFVFTNEDFPKAMKALGLKPDEFDKVATIGYGCLMRKESAAEFEGLSKKHRQEFFNEISEDTSGDGFIYDMFVYELAKHDFCVSYDSTDALDALGFTLEYVFLDNALRHGYTKAVQYFENI